MLNFFRRGEVVTEATNGAGPKRQVVSEIVGRAANRVARRVLPQTTLDETQTNYKFYDELRHGKLKTYELGALFARPIEQHKSSWVLGRGFQVRTEDEATTEALNEFANDNLQTIIDWYELGQGLGDAYLVVNPDRSLTPVAPNQVTKVVDDLNFRRALRYVLKTKTKKIQATDEYRLDGRTVTIKKLGGRQTELETFGGIGFDGELLRRGEVEAHFANLIGRLPVVHLAHRRGPNEIYGHSVHEPLLPLYAEYDDVLTNTLMGVKLMSNPKPALEESAAPDRDVELLSGGKTRSYVNADGETVTEPVVDFGPDTVAAVTGKLKYLQPAPFTADAMNALQILFLLMLQHTHIIEAIWGGAIASSRASVDAQMPAFALFVARERLWLETVLTELLRVWLAFEALVNARIQPDVKIEYVWPRVIAKDEALQLNKVKLARADGMLSRADGLAQLELVDDATEAVEKAQEEAQSEEAAFNARVDEEIAALEMAG